MDKRMYKTGLLLLTQPVQTAERQTGQVINLVLSKVHNLYVHLLPSLCNEKTPSKKPNNVSQAIIPCTKGTLSLVTKYYSEMSKICNLQKDNKTDMRFVLSNISNKMTRNPKSSNSLHKLLEVVYIDQPYKNLEYLKKYVAEQFLSEKGDISEIIFTNLPELKHDLFESESDGVQKSYSSVCVGGTFDRIHTGHKILLSEACLLAEEILTVGVTDESMLTKKVLNELIQPADKRVSDVVELLTDIAPHLEHRVVPISDPYGPSITDPDIEAIVVSEETLKGGQMVNDRRKEKGMKELDIHTIRLVEDSCHTQFEENKISSSSGRKRLLGTLMKPPIVKDQSIPLLPYIIGLTGGIASGKSSVCKRLQNLGAHIIDCDKLGHRAYLKGTPAFHEVVQVFGDDVVGEDGEINRKVLGPKVFSSKDQLERLNQIVWPAIGELAREEMKPCIDNKGAKSVIVLDAAVLLEAGWDHMTHEIWVTFVPKDEAIKRIMERNSLSEEQAKNRIESQLSNTDRIQRANVLLSTLWEPEYTQQQVEKAWELLQQRLVDTEVNK